MGLLEDKRLSECWREFILKFPAIYLVCIHNTSNKLSNCLKISSYFLAESGWFFLFQFDWIIWPPSQYINFKYVPAAARVLYVNIITVVWDIFLSYIKHNVNIIVSHNLFWILNIKWQISTAVLFFSVYVSELLINHFLSRMTY